MNFKRELGIVVADDTIISTSVGTLVEVEFDFFEVWQRYKMQKFNSLYLIHTHPTGHLHMSKQDWTMLTGWAKAFSSMPVMMDVISFQGTFANTEVPVLDDWSIIRDLTKVFRYTFKLRDKVMIRIEEERRLLGSQLHSLLLNESFKKESNLENFSRKVGDAYECSYRYMFQNKRELFTFEDVGGINESKDSVNMRSGRSRE